MPAELDESTGRVALAFTGERDAIWHGAGQQLDPTRLKDIDYLCEEACLNYEVVKAPLQYVMPIDGPEEWTEARVAPNLSATVRTDTMAMLGVVSNNKYKIDRLQPRNIVEFFHDFLSDNKLTITTLGALRGGKVVWAQAELSEEYSFLLPGNDLIKSYVRLQTSYDTSRSTSLVLTGIRQVCANTESLIESATKGQQFVTRHSTEFNAKALQAAFGLLGERHAMTADAWNALAKTPVSNELAFKYFIKLLKLDEVKQEDWSTRAANKVDTLQSLYFMGPGAELKSAKGTAYGMLQAVTHFVDHMASTRDTMEDGSMLSRVASSWLGAGAAMKEKARNLALEMTGV